ncbi:MAG: nuclease-related domain-containing protein [Oscillospiraceae bacterium]|nr:nuclease-related domain-containing protein [Oscillospiraceae bacterium]
MNTELIVILSVFGAINICAVIFLIYHSIKAKEEQNKVGHYGDLAESLVSEYLIKNFPGAVLLTDIYLKTDYGLTQIDQILLCRYGIFVIETKSHNGQIQTGSSKQWTQRYKDKVIRFHNPVYQNDIHKRALGRILDIDPSLSKLNINGVTVFTSRSVSFTHREKDVVKLPALSSYIKNCRAFKSARRGGVKLMLTKTMIQQTEKLILSNCEKSRVKHQMHKNKMSNLNKNRE